MSRKTWLLLDCNYLCHRVKHTTGGLSHENTPTGVIYGFLKTVSHFQELFNTPYVVFCWDSRTSKREEIFPAYKTNRKDKYKDMSKSEIRFEKEFRWQMMMLRRKYLPTIGYKNVFVQKGYEADDIIASICLNLNMLDECIIITADQDLYQLISSYTSFYNPSKGKTLTLQGFKKKYGIEPWLWSSVKVISGCSTDEIPGVIGVGEKIAIKYIKGELKKTSKVYKRIRFFEAAKAATIYRRNTQLIKLPFEGSKVPQIRDDEITQKGWNDVMKRLGMKSLRDKAPIFKRK